MRFSLIVAIVGAIVVAGPGSVLAQNQWVGSATDDSWSEPTLWSFNHVPTSDEDVLHPLSGEPTITYDLATSLIKSFQGVADTSVTDPRVLFMDDGMILRSSGDVTRTGTGSYRIDFREGCQLIVGPSTAQDIYGFHYNFVAGFFDSNPNLDVSDTMGYGPVDVINFAGTIRAKTVDCAFPGGVNPITASPWKLDGTADAAFATLNLQADEIRNVGKWDFLSSNSSAVVDARITATFIELFDDPSSTTDGVVTLSSGNNTITIVAHDDIEEVVRVPDHAQIVHSNSFGQSLIEFETGAEPGAPVGRFELAGRGALVRPDDYPEQPNLPGRLTLEFRNGVVAVETIVSKEGLAHDLSFTNLFIKSGSEFDLECFTPDACNLMLMDGMHYLGFDGFEGGHLYVPLRNRCQKYLDLIKMTEVPASPQPTLELVDEINNQEPDYVPAGYGAEALYCRRDETQNFIVEVGESRAYSHSSGTPESTQFIHLRLTRFGDADGDYDVDIIDFARFQNAYTGSGGTTWYPLSDYATADAGEAPYPGGSNVVSPADCDVDGADYAFFYARWRRDASSVARLCSLTDPLHPIPTNNANLLNGDPNIVVCGGPYHVETSFTPPLDCPNCEMYPFPCGCLPNCAVPCPGQGSCEESAMFGGGESFAMSAAGQEAVQEEAAPIVFVEPAALPPSPELVASWLAAELSAADLASVAALYAADAANGDEYAAAVAALLN